MAVDIGMDQLQSEWRVCNVYGTLHRMRQERAGSIQTFEQYLFVHQVSEVSSRIKLASQLRPSSTNRHC